MFHDTRAPAPWTPPGLSARPWCWRGPNILAIGDGFGPWTFLWICLMTYGFLNGFLSGFLNGFLNGFLSGFSSTEDIWIHLQASVECSGHRMWGFPSGPDTRACHAITMRHQDQIGTTQLSCLAREAREKYGDGTNKTAWRKPDCLNSLWLITNHPSASCRNQHSQITPWSSPRINLCHGSQIRSVLGGLHSWWTLSHSLVGSSRYILLSAKPAYIIY